MQPEVYINAIIFCKAVDGRSQQCKAVTLRMEEFRLRGFSVTWQDAWVFFPKREEKYLVKEQLFRSAVTEIFHSIKCN